MAVESDLDIKQVNTIKSISEVEPVADRELTRLKTFIKNSSPETELTMSAGQLMSLIKRIEGQ